MSLAKCIQNQKPAAIILFVNPRNRYLFPLIAYIKIAKIKLIYWGHGIDLQNKKSFIKNILNRIQQRLSDALILYAEHLKKYINPSRHAKCFIANNTLNLAGIEIPQFAKEQLLLSFGIATSRNIIFTGRVQKRKRIQDLLDAFELLDREDTGLIIVGPIDKDMNSIVSKTRKNVYFIGPCYGIKVLQLLQSSDVYCMPGAIGLSIVDAQFCGLPVVTEAVEHGPEIMYLINGVNGYIVERDNPAALAEYVSRLLTNEELRSRFSAAARNEIATNGHIDTMCEGFVQCLDFITKRRAVE